MRLTMLLLLLVTGLATGCGDEQRSGPVAPSVGAISCKEGPRGGTTSVNTTVTVSCGDEDVVVVPPVVVAPEPAE